MFPVSVAVRGRTYVRMEASHVKRSEENRIVAAKRRTLGDARGSYQHPRASIGFLPSESRPKSVLLALAWAWFPTSPSKVRSQFWKSSRLLVPEDNLAWSWFKSYQFINGAEESGLQTWNHRSNRMTVQSSGSCLGLQKSFTSFSRWTMSSISPTLEITSGRIDERSFIHGSSQGGTCRTPSGWYRKM